MYFSKLGLINITDFVIRVISSFYVTSFFYWNACLILKIWKQSSLLFFYSVTNLDVKFLRFLEFPCSYWGNKIFVHVTFKEWLLVIYFHVSASEKCHLLWFSESVMRHHKAKLTGKYYLIQDILWHDQWDECNFPHELNKLFGLKFPASYQLWQILEEVGGYNRWNSVTITNKIKILVQLNCLIVRISVYF